MVEPRPRKFFSVKIQHTKIFQHENFPIYGILSMYTYRSELSNLEKCPTKFDIGPPNLRNLSNIRSYFVLRSLHHYFRTMHVHHTNLYTHIRLIAPTKLMHNHIIKALSTSHSTTFCIQGNLHTHAHTHAHTLTHAHTHTHTFRAQFMQQQGPGNL